MIKHSKEEFKRRFKGKVFAETRKRDPPCLSGGRGGQRIKGGFKGKLEKKVRREGLKAQFEGKVWKES